MRRRGPAREPGDREVGSAPEEVHRTDLSGEAGPGSRHDAMRVDQRESTRVARSGSRAASYEPCPSSSANGIESSTSTGRASIDTWTSRSASAAIVARVEAGDRARLERDLPAIAVGRPDDELVVDEVELDLEARAPVVHERRREAAGEHVQRYLPPVVDHRLEREADLADDLGPHVQRVARRASRRPRRKLVMKSRACGPYRRVLPLHQRRPPRTVFDEYAVLSDVPAPEAARCSRCDPATDSTNWRLKRCSNLRTSWAFLHPFGRPHWPAGGRPSSPRGGDASRRVARGATPAESSTPREPSGTVRRMARTGPAPVAGPSVPLQWPLVGRHQEMQLFERHAGRSAAHGFVVHGPSGRRQDPLSATSAWRSRTGAAARWRAERPVKERNRCRSARSRICCRPDSADDRFDLVAVLDAVAPELRDQVSTARWCCSSTTSIDSMRRRRR